MRQSSFKFKHFLSYLFLNLLHIKSEEIMKCICQFQQNRRQNWEYKLLIIYYNHVDFLKLNYLNFPVESDTNIHRHRLFDQNSIRSFQASFFQIPDWFSLKIQQISFHLHLRETKSIETSRSHDFFLILLLRKSTIFGFFWIRISWTTLIPNKKIRVKLFWSRNF